MPTHVLMHRKSLRRFLRHIKSATVAFRCYEHKIIGASLDYVSKCGIEVDVGESILKRRFAEVVDARQTLGWSVTDDCSSWRSGSSGRAACYTAAILLILARSTDLEDV
jgi:hypothetical protein